MLRKRAVHFDGNPNRYLYHAPWMIGFWYMVGMTIINGMKAGELSILQLK